MVNKNHAILGLISLVVLASGCTNTSETDVTVTQNTGVTVQGFSVFPNPMLTDTQGDVTVRLQNTGGATAENTEVVVYNVPWAGSAGPQTWSYSGQDSTQGSDPGDPVLEFGELQPPNPDQNIPSTSIERLLTVNAPTGDSGISSDYEFIADIAYDYETNAEATVTVMGNERYRQERPTRSRPTVENTGGPIQMKIRTETPIITRGGDTNERVCVLVQNVGGGTASFDGNENTVELTISLPNAQNTKTTEVSISRQTDQGGECIDIGPEISNLNPSQQVSFPIEATADYRYEKTTRTSVTVEGSN